MRAGAEPLYSTNEGLAEDRVGEGLRMNVLFRGTHTEIIYRHRGDVVGEKKSDCPDTESRCIRQRAAQVMGRIPSQAGLCGLAGVAVYKMRQDVFSPPWASLGRFSVPTPRS